jgi:hypothetical protein
MEVCTLMAIQDASALAPGPAGAGFRNGLSPSTSARKMTPEAGHSNGEGYSGAGGALSEEMWEERISGMSKLFGEPDDQIGHSVIPFYLGGGPDIVVFCGFAAGKLYVTCDLVGSDEQPPNSHGQYELAVLHEKGEQWGVDIIFRLARYTTESVIDDLHTMDIRPAAPEGSTIVAFLFRRIGDFRYFGQPANVICCVGITEEELRFAQECGGEALVKALGPDFLLTDLWRDSRL